MSFTLGRVRLSVDFSLAAMLTVYALLGGGNMLAISLFASLVHELGHITALRLQGGVPDSVELTARGVLISAGRPPTVLFALGGVCANIAAALVFAAAAPLWHAGGMICAANAAMGLVNLIPARPLDGAQALSILLERYPSGERLCSALSVLSCIALSGGGVFLLMRSQANFSLLFLALWLMAAIFDKALDAAAKRG